MLSKCANPACLARFHYLHEGRIFNIERASDPTSLSLRKIEHYWLCERCMQTHTVVLENGEVRTRPLRRGLGERAGQERFEGKRDVA